jgi:phosphoribosylformylglycinamidine cyclo-ligase
MQRLGHVPEAEMYRTFNMGIGIIIICAAANINLIKTHVAAHGTDCYEVGHVVSDAGEVKLV